MKERDLIKTVIDRNLADKERIRQKSIAAGKNQKVRRGSYMKKVIAVTMIIAVLAIVAVTAMATIYTPQNNTTKPMNASGYSDVMKAIEEYNNKLNSFNSENFFGALKSTRDSFDAPLGDMPESSNKLNSDDYSSTNVQTEGMDEGDIVKNDGRYIYKINTKGFVIIETNNGQLSKVYSESIENYVPQEMYINGDQLIVIGGIYEYQQYSGGYQIAPMVDCISYIRYTKTDIRVYDVTNRDEPVLERQITVDGNYHTSRIIEATNKLIYMVNYNFNYGNEENYIPKIKDTTLSEQTTSMPASEIYIYDDISYYEYLIIGEILLSAPEAEGKRAAFLGLGGEIYVSSENIFVATYDSQSIYERNLLGWVKANIENKPTTRIVKIGLDTLEQKAAGRVYGMVKDRYSLDEYQGYLRVATTVRSRTIYNNLYVLKADLTVVGKVENIAPGETIFSARFNKERGIIVTFEQTDPYFIFDLSDPANPFITGELKEDGVSYYLHYIEGTEYTIGIGLMSEFNGWVQWTGLKVSLYDNSTGTAVNVNTIEIPGSCHAEIFHNPRALLYDKTRGLLAFSYENWQYNNNGYNYYSSMTQGLAVFKFDVEQEEDDDKLIYRGTLTNLDSQVDPNYGWNGYYDSYLSFITRGIRIGDYIYTVSDKYVSSYDLENLEEIVKLDLYEEIA